MTEPKGGPSKSPLKDLRERGDAEASLDKTIDAIASTGGGAMFGKSPVASFEDVINAPELAAPMTTGKRSLTWRTEWYRWYGALTPAVQTDADSYKHKHLTTVGLIKDFLSLPEAVRVERITAASFAHKCVRVTEVLNSWSTWLDANKRR